MMIKSIISISLGILLAIPPLMAQPPLVIEGNGLFRSTNSTNLDIISSDAGTNSLMRFGDNASIKASMGYNGNNDYFNFSTAPTLGADDFTMSLNGLIGINAAPGNHRMLINQNSTSGNDGDVQLNLQENNSGDFARMRFTNLGDDSYWEISAEAVSGSHQMEFYYTDDNSNDATLLVINGEDESVGIHQTNPEGYLHIKQQFAGANALTFVNDDNDDEWNFRIGDEDILIYFNNSIRGGFDVSTGNYNNFPPAPALSASTKMQEHVLDKVMLLQPKLAQAEKSDRKLLGFNPQEVGKVNPDWVVPVNDGAQLGLDYLQLTVLAIKTVQEQQLLLEQQAARLAELKERRAARLARLGALEGKLEQLGY